MSPYGYSDRHFGAHMLPFSLQWLPYPVVGPGFSYTSHLMELQAAGEELISRGHEVYMPLASTWSPDKKTGTRLLKKSQIKELDFHVDPAIAQLVTGVDPSQTSFPEVFAHIQRMICESARFMLEDEAFVNASRHLRFDMVIVDRFPLAPCSFLVPHALRVPYVSLGAQFDQYLGGTPTLPSIFNSLFSPVPGLKTAARTQQWTLYDNRYTFI